jgi:hypothetical protein
MVAPRRRRNAEGGVAAIRGAYVRPNEGKGNPRTQVIRSADSGSAHQTIDRKGQIETQGAISLD